MGSLLVFSNSVYRFDSKTTEVFTGYTIFNAEDAEKKEKRKMTNDKR
jgi:hypothetical protein